VSEAPVRPAGADDRNRQKRGDRRRQQILDAAVELFAANGYRGTGVAALAERVGMTATGLLYYFGSKERLLQEVVAERSRTGELPVVPELRLADLRQLGAYNARQGTLTRLYVVLAVESLDADGPLHEFFVDRYALTRSFFAALVEAEKARGEVRADVDADQVAREMLGVVLGLELQWFMDPGGVDYPSAVEAYIDRLVADLSKGTE
jgi:AcrR family transcriptional regulator